MGQTLRLTSAADGAAFAAWREAPRDARRGGLVMLHAIWGVTPHIRDLAGDFAGHGYEVLAPNLSERFEPGFAELDRDPSARERRMAWAQGVGWGRDCLDDIAATVAALTPPVFVVGFCFGGTAAWLSACRLRGIAAVAAFYGGQIHDHRFETPLCPVHLHLGKTDPMIPPEHVAAIEQAQADLAIWRYDAGHAFMAPGDDFHAPSARLAMLRTLQLFHRAAGGRGEV